MSKSMTVISKGLSQERFGAYRRATCGNAAALALYEWNNAISAALWADIAHLEILVRNAMHEQLTAWSSRTCGEPRWYLDPNRVLTPNRLADVAAARQRATTGRRGKPETSGRVVTELSFGFWRYLVSSHYDRTLWKPILSRSFPLQPRRKAVHTGLAHLHELRNRIAHHEPIHAERLEQRHEELLTLLEWINPHYRTWVKRQSTVTSQLVARPAVSAEPEPTTTAPKRPRSDR